MTMRPDFRIAPFLLTVALSVVLLSAVEDPRLLAAEASLSDGQPDRAIALLRDAAATRVCSRERLCLVRAQWTLSNPRSALMTLDEGSAGDCANWPVALRGTAAQLAAELHIVVGEIPQARTLLAVALAQRREGDLACLCLAAELAAAAGDVSEARRLAEDVWSRVPRTAESAQGGIVLARLVAQNDPTSARAILAQVRAVSGLSVQQRVSAAELLCRLLLPIQPGQCLVVAERELSASTSVQGTLVLYRALALAALGAEEAEAQLTAVPNPWCDDPAVRAALAHIAADRTTGRQANVQQRMERAAAAADLGQWDRVISLVSADADQIPAALIILVRCPTIDARPLVASHAARDPRASLALTRVLVCTNHPHEAWVAVQPALLAVEQGGDVGALVWAAEAARHAAPDHMVALLERAVAADPAPADIGIAWCRLAEYHESQGFPGDQEWMQAAERLAADHPWKPGAIARTARFILANAGDLVQAERLLRGVSQGLTCDALRCRFLLAQVLVRQGRMSEARHCAESLLEHADQSQRARVQIFLDGLVPGESRPGDTP